MHFERQSTGSWFNLPREDGIAYAAQESWVQNETIQVNSVMLMALCWTLYALGWVRITFCSALRTKKSGTIKVCIIRSRDNRYF